MKNLNRIFEIAKILIEKKTELGTIDKNTNSIQYNQIQDEMNELRIELDDLTQIDLADSSKALDESDKRIKNLLDQIDFHNMESDELRVFGKVQNFFSSLENELNKIIDDIANSEEKPNYEGSIEDNKEREG